MGQAFRKASLVAVCAAVSLLTVSLSALRVSATPASEDTEVATRTQIADQAPVLQNYETARPLEITADQPGKTAAPSIEQAPSRRIGLGPTSAGAGPHGGKQAVLKKGPLNKAVAGKGAPGKVAVVVRSDSAHSDSAHSDGAGRPKVACTRSSSSFFVASCDSLLCPKYVVIGVGF